MSLLTTNKGVKPKFHFIRRGFYRGGGVGGVAPHGINWGFGGHLRPQKPGSFLRPIDDLAVHPTANHNYFFSVMITFNFTVLCQFTNQLF